MKESHRQLVIESAVGLGFVAMLIVVIVFVLFWWMTGQHKNDGSSEDGVVLKAQQQLKVSGLCREHTLRSDSIMSIDEGHEPCEQFGINEICKVTHKKGVDLARISRPIETTAGERQLSEERLAKLVSWQENNLT